jgi:hypothetical protein
MFTHRAQIQLKSNSFIELSQKNQKKIIPALRLKKGFFNGVTSIDTIWLTAIEETHWETKADAEIYPGLGIQPEQKTVSSFIC